jgi:hypothetical protein
MKSKLLGLMALLPLLGFSPANASTYTYNVNFDIGGTDGSGDIVTGTIMTDSDSGPLVGSDFLSWSFTLPGIGTITSSSGTGSFLLPTDISATSAGLFYNSVACGGPVTFTGAAGGLNFECGFIADYAGTGSGGDTDFLDLDGTPASFPFATMGATPLPAALPLFGTVLGVGGLLGWRRKRKNALAAA